MSSRIGHKFFKACQVGLASSLVLASGFGLAQESVSQLNTVLDIETLYEAVEPEAIHGKTAVELLQQLQTKHYSSIEINDGFSSLLFDRYMDALDGSHLYLSLIHI